MLRAAFEAGPGDYDGWELNEATYMKCPDDCGERSPETASLAELLAWIDAHMKTCAPAWLDQSE